MGAFGADGSAASGAVFSVPAFSSDVSVLGAVASFGVSAASLGASMIGSSSFLSSIGAASILGASLFGASVVSIAFVSTAGAVIASPDGAAGLSSLAIIQSSPLWFPNRKLWRLPTGYDLRAARR